MNISNVRMGFATNSSSSHSILLNAPAANLDSPDGDFGWQDFLLQQPAEKSRYMAQLLRENLTRHGLPSLHAMHVAKSLLACDDAKLEDVIDHQSVIALPSRRYKGREAVDLTFAKEFSDYVINNPAFSIAGGNDNEEDLYVYGGKAWHPGLPVEGHFGRLRARKDGDWWVVYNRDNGTKIRLSFEANPKTYTCSTYPELIDIKITNFCPYGCEFCYQSSTLEGKHASEDAVLMPAFTLEDMGVFEVALGGGETTLHPHFADLIRDLDEHYGITPNFTTFTTNWMTDTRIVDAVKRHCGGIALSLTKPYSSHSLDKIKTALRWMEDKNNPGIQFQAIIGVLGTEEILFLFRRLQHQRVTLLGYKSFGRGLPNVTNVKPVDMRQVLSEAKKYHIELGMDTVAVRQYCADLDEAEIPLLLRTTQEGAFSMYIDAVEKHIARDSYTADTISYRDQSFEEVILANYPFANQPY